MKAIFLFAITFLFGVQFLVLTAQERTLKIPFVKGELSEAAYAGDTSGLLIANVASMEEAEQKGQKGRYPGAKIYRINAQGEKLWEVLSGQQSTHGLLLGSGVMGKIIHSSNLEYAYYVYGSKDNLSLLQIDDRGQTKSLKAENLVKFNFLHAIFCTKEKLGILVRRGPLGDSKTTQTLHLWNNRDLNKSEVMLTLPQHSQGEKYEAWSYIGNNEESIFFMSRSHFHDDKVRVKFLAVGFDGQIQKSFDLNFAANKPLRLFYFPHTRRFQRAAFLDTDLDRIDADGAVQLDIRHNAIYTWGIGMWIDEIDRKKTREGFYLNKYDLDGRFEWTHQSVLPESLFENGLVISREYLATALHVDYDSNPRLHIKGANTLHTLVFSAEGQLKETFSNKHVGLLKSSDVAFDFIGREESPAFLLTKKRLVEEAKNSIYDKSSFHFYRFIGGEMLTEFSPKQDRFNVYWFKR